MRLGRVIKRVLLHAFLVVSVVFGSALWVGVSPAGVSAADALDSKPALGPKPNDTKPGDTGAAVAAKTVDPMTGQPEEKEEPEEADAGGGTCLADPSVLEDIQRTREQLSKRQRDLDAREAELKAREQAVADQIKKLENLQDAIATTEALHKAESEEKVAKVVEMIETMSPKAAAKVFGELDESLAVAAMEKMDTVKLAKIMNNLEPRKSSRLSELLAGVVRARDAQTAAAGQDLARAQAGAEPNRTTSSIQSEKGGEKDDGHGQ